MYLLRLDDAATYIRLKNWDRIEELLDRYSIKPLVGLIPNVKDPELLVYDSYDRIWERAHKWEEKGWTVALHGYTHVYETTEGGINPVNKRSEFAGLALSVQEKKIEQGYQILTKHGFSPEVFFAPSHTFDKNTLTALKNKTPIKIISDTVAINVYYENGFYYIPQQTGRARKLPFKITTFCYHPNKMTDNDFVYLESFIQAHKEEFTDYNSIPLLKRKKTFADKILQKMYYLR